MTDQREDAVEIHGDGSAPLGIREFVDRSVFRRPDAVIGDQDIESSEAFYGLVYQIFGGFQARQVARDGGAVFLATLLDECVGGCFRVLIIEKDFGPSRHECAHCGRANPAGAAGDESNFAFEREGKWHG